MLLTNIVFGALAVWLVWRQVGPILGIQRVTAQEVQQALDQNNMTLIDVRTVDEYSHGHIASSICIPLSDIRRRTKEISQEKPVVLICRSGYRAMQAFHILKRRGFSGHAVLQGGMIAWESMRSRGYVEPLEHVVKEDGHESSI